MRLRYPSAAERFGALLLGVFGGPLAIQIGFLFRSWGPVFLFCVTVLLGLYFVQPSEADANGQRSLVARIGVVLTFVWAVPLMLWAGIFYLNPK